VVMGGGCSEQTAFELTRLAGEGATTAKQSLETAAV
jgi:hypothetical protein